MCGLVACEGIRMMDHRHRENFFQASGLHPSPAKLG